MWKFLTYAILSLISVGLWLVSFLLATIGLAFGILSASQLEWNGFIISIASFILAFCCQWLAKFFDPSFIYYEEDW